jgi:hypothetical protein
VERIGSAYRLGTRLHELAQRVYTPEHDRIRELATPFLTDLYQLTHQTAHLAVLHGMDVLYLSKLYGPHTVPPLTRVGGRAPAHCTAVGKILLAYGDETSPRDGPLVRRTPAASPTRCFCGATSPRCASTGSPSTTRRLVPGYGVSRLRSSPHRDAQSRRCPSVHRPPVSTRARMLLPYDKSPTRPAAHLPRSWAVAGRSHDRALSSAMPAIDGGPREAG